MPKETKPETAETKQPSLLDRVEQIKDNLKNVVRDLTALTDGVKVIERDKRANEKEIETVRATLNKIRQVTI